MKQVTEDFFQRMIEKLSILNEEVSKYSFLEEVCHYLDISHAFIYEYNYTGEFLRKEYFEISSANPLPTSINIQKKLGLELLSDLCSKKVVLCIGDCVKNSLEEHLALAFNVNTLIFIPILNQHYELAGFVGLSDRRKEIRHATINVNKACALLTLLANTVKLEMFQKGIANTEAALANVLDHIGIDVYVNDYYTHDILYVNKSMAAPYGGVKNMLGKKCWQSIFDDKSAPCEFCPQPKLLDEEGNINKTYQWDYERPFDKSWFRVLSSSFPWTDGRIAHLVASVDITENMKNQMVIEKLAQFDHLTGLANRRSLQDDIESFVNDKRKFAGKWYVLFCDLDGFKAINDTLGHDAGDVLLKNIAEDIKQMCNNDIKAYRQGGDEFVFIVKDMNSEDFIRKTIKELLALFSKKHTYEDKEISCGCSIGVAHYPSQAKSAKELIHLADTAMYQVKKEGRGSVRFYFEGDYLEMNAYFDRKK